MADRKGLSDTTATQRGDQPGRKGRVVRLPVLTLVCHPEAARVGEQVLVEDAPVRLDRTSRVFPGGPLADAGISRDHACVESVAGGGPTVRDLASKNGTFVNERQVGATPHSLQDGDVIRVGGVLLLLHAVEVPPPEDADVPSIAGISQAIRRLRGQVARFAGRAAPVLVQGETGTGKDLVASALAALGRPGRPFRVLNVNAAPATLIEAMLFGHQKGAFTDAGEARPGLFRECDRGTLFLDEIGDLAEEVQVKLLRAVEDGNVLPIGASRPVPADVRIVAATHRELLDEVAAGRFREDLFARLSPLVIRCPALRERREDIPVLALRFSGGRAFTVPAMTRLLDHPWPFNVRELKGVVEEAVAESPASGPLALSDESLERLAAHRRYHAAGRAPGTPDRAVVEAALERAGGNMTRAAAELGKDRAQLYRIAKRLGVDPDRFRRGL